MGGLKKKRRIQLLLIGAVLMTAATTMVIFAFDPAYFKTPLQVLAEQPSPEQLLRLGGFVAEGSLIRGQGKTVMFDVTAEGQSI
ncbi:MAG: cytochrome c maturation protein CcmE, partial [Pseudomonadota bacterium]